MRKRSAIVVVGAVVIAALIIFGVSAAIRYRDDAYASGCISNMRLIDHAKEVWAIKHNAKPGDVVRWEDITIFIDGGVPKCPAGGEYILGPIDTVPRCSLGGRHAYLPFE